MILRPDKNLKNIYEITPDMLHKMGVKAMLVDLDSTTLQSKTGKFTEKTLEWFKQFSKDFYIAIVTNNKNPEYIETVEQTAPCKIYSNAKKPCPHVINQIKHGMFMSGREIVVVGDRPLTDILAGKLARTKTILVGSINDSENIPTKFVIRPRYVDVVEW